MQNTRLDLKQRELIPFGTVAILHKAGKPTHKVELRAKMRIMLGPVLLTYNAVGAYLFDGKRV